GLAGAAAADDRPLIRPRCSHDGCQLIKPGVRWRSTAAAADRKRDELRRPLSAPPRIDVGHKLLQIYLDEASACAAYEDIGLDQNQNRPDSGKCPGEPDAHEGDKRERERRSDYVRDQSCPEA